MRGTRSVYWKGGALYSSIGDASMSWTKDSTWQRLVF